MLIPNNLGICSFTFYSFYNVCLALETPLISHIERLLQLRTNGFVKLSILVLGRDFEETVSPKFSMGRKNASKVSQRWDSSLGKIIAKIYASN